MKKWITLLKSVVISFLVYMWFLGSCLLVQIDSQSKGDFQQQIHLRKWENKLNNMSKNVNSYCKKLERKNLERSLEINPIIQPVEEQMKKADEILLKARKEKTVRDNLIYIPELQQMWCLVPKAASTSWSKKILENVNSIKLKPDLQNASIPIQVVLRKHYGNIGTKKYNELLDSDSTKKVLLIRHPFIRLISAFEDKLKDRKARSDSMYFFRHYGVKINRTFRKSRRHNKRKEPTFNEFVDYLLHTDPIEYDEHWKPISLLCGLCHVKYDHIIKLEELQNDLHFHLLKLGFDSARPLQRKNVGLKVDSKTMNKYFASLTSDQIRQLLRKYDDDFRLFGYDNNFV